MSDYSSNTVNQLKEILESRGLPTTGKKADLVERLVEADKSGEVEEESKPEETTEATETPVEEPQEATEESEESAPVEAEETKPEPPKKMTPEERKQLAVELLNKKIQRAEKFGDEASAENARKDLSRVEKFGVEPGTALAKEIGLVDNSFNNGLRDKPFRKFKRGGFKHRGGRGNHRGVSKPRYNNRR
ncbi:protein Tho1p [[Candida] jaroonii]|uniref:Protein Tho1p n=1 Tax=[Candida] jaroonii TaxID=467808 RepID=A0ACA9Y7U2_9ASCO|nr:protein Tho1p [[Candida] jaroonii]